MLSPVLRTVYTIVISLTVPDSPATSISAEPEVNYKKSKKSDSQVEDFSRALVQMQLLVAELSEKLNNSYKILDELTAGKKIEDPK